MLPRPRAAILLPWICTRPATRCWASWAAAAWASFTGRATGIVKVHAAGDAAGLPFLVCELVVGARPLDVAANRP